MPRAGEMVFSREEDINWLTNALQKSYILKKHFMTEQIVFTYVGIIDQQLKRKK